jgi:hypothetical protein
MRFLTFCLALIFCSCIGENKKPEPVGALKRADPNIHSVKDSFGNEIEKWGNYNSIDQNMNFRHFYIYDINGLLIQEKRYWFDEENTDCLIRDSSEYDLLVYHYTRKDNKYVLVRETCYGTNYDKNGNYIGRKLYYIKNLETTQFVYSDDSMGSDKR